MRFGRGSNKFPLKATKGDLVVDVKTRKMVFFTGKDWRYVGNNKGITGYDQSRLPRYIPVDLGRDKVVAFEIWLML